MRWKTRFACNVILPLLALMFLLHKVTDACQCLMQHPQVHFCQSHFVAVVHNIKPTRVSLTEIAYTVKVKKIFKNIHEHGINLGLEKIYTPAEESLCSATLNPGESYLIGGKMMNGKPSISLCSISLRWSEVTRRQRKGLRELYKRNCQCKISFTGFREKGALIEKTGNQTCLWEGSPGPQDCQEKFGICVLNQDNSCSWAPVMQYRECIKEHRGLRHQEQQRPWSP